MFDRRTEPENNHGHKFDNITHRNDNYNGWGALNYGARVRKTAENYESYRNWNNGGVQFRAENVEDESGVCSPPLWKTSPPPRSPVHQPNNYRYLSPTSKTQAIARGQWELMEMVKNMPESCYELSLKDLVEQPRVEGREERLILERNFGDEEAVRQRVMMKRQQSKKNGRKAKSSRSLENRGLFLKMVFPFSFGSKKKNNSATNTCSKVSPKPEALDKSSIVDKEWWKKRSSVSSSNSGSSNSSRKGSGYLPGCCRLFCFKTAESEK